MINKLVSAKVNLRNKLVIHLSGSKSIDSLIRLKLIGAEIGSIHIMQTFPDKLRIDVDGCYAAIESDNNNVRDFLFGLAVKLKMLPFDIKSEAKIYYHLMGVFASNFTIANFYNSDKCRDKFSWNMPGTAQLLIPIVEKTLSNISGNGISEALSGPVKRGDLETIQEHITALKKDKLMLVHYLSASLTLLESARKTSSIQEEKYTRIKKYLTTELKSAAAEM